MSWRVFAARVRGLFSGGAMERQMEDELRIHLEMQAEDNVRMGMNPAEARYAAMRHFGAMDSAKEICREKRSFPMIEALLKDAGYALRALGRNPGFTTVAIITLALGIGANTAIFSVVQAILLEPLPYKDPAALVLISNTYPNFISAAPLGLSPGDFNDFQKQTRTMSGLAAYVDLPQGLNLTGLGQPERLEARYATSGLLPLLGIQPAVGRNFAPEEDKRGMPLSVMISHRLWQSHFGGDPSAIGKTLTLDGSGYNIAGVLPASFQLSPTADLWLPVGQYADDLNGRVHHPFTTVGRLKPGAALASVQDELDALNRQAASAFPASHRNWKVVAQAMENPAAARLRPLLILLFGAVAFVLLIACANVVNLVLARNAARQKEIAVRIALGATLPRLLMQLLVETALLTGVGAALGVSVAALGLRIMRTLLPENLAPIAAASLSLPVLAFTAGASLFAVIVCGLIPGLQILKRDSHAALKAAGRGSDASGGRKIRDVLVVAETSLAIVLLLGAALFIRSFRNALHVDPGFETQEQLSLQFGQPGLPASVLAKMTQAQQAELARKQGVQFEQIVNRIGALPGVRAVGAVSVLPLSSELRSASRFVVEGQPISDASARPVAETRSASLGYFAAMGIPLRAGRWLTHDDLGGNNILVNETMAHRFWPGEEAIGKRINLCSMYPTPCWLSIVGVVGNVHQHGLDALTPSSDVYFAGGNTPSVVIRAAQDPASLSRAAVEAIHKEAPDLPVTRIVSLKNLLADSLAPRRFSSALLGAFAILALLLAAVGIYGVMNYVVGLRTREIGLRVALGAQPGGVWRLVTFSAIRLTLIGTVIGLVGSLALVKTLSGLAFQVKPDDPATIAASSLLLAAVVVLACYIPARRAMRVDPIVALREE